MGKFTRPEQDVAGGGPVMNREPVRVVLGRVWRVLVDLEEMARRIDAIVDGPCEREGAPPEKGPAEPGLILLSQELLGRAESVANRLMVIEAGLGKLSGPIPPPLTTGMAAGWQGSSVRGD